MEFQLSPLQLEVDKIFSGDNKPVHYYYTIQFYVNGELVTPFKIVSIDNNRDFIDNVADEMLITIMISAGTYVTKLYRNRNNIEAILVAQPIYPTSSNANPDLSVITKKYVGVLLEDYSDPILESNHNTLTSEEALNISNLIVVSVQLVDKAVDLMRMRSVGGSYRSCTNEEVIKTILTNESRKINLQQDYLLIGVDMVPATNKATREHIVIPQGTKLTYVPQYLHERCGGVYSSGLGYYYVDRYWYVYPCFDVTRFNKVKKTLTIINIPANKYPHVEKSYRQTASNLTILCTGEVKFSDKTDVQELQDGNGLRFADANKFLNDFVSVHDNKAIANRAKNVSEVIFKKRKSGNDIVHMSEIDANSNMYVQYSELAKRRGALLELVWENAFPDAIYPGMPIKLMYLDGSDIKEVYGTILKVQEYIYARDKVAFSTSFIHNVALLLYINNDKTLNAV